MPDTASFRRRFGVLLPLPSLPGPGAIGGLGEPARRWLAWLRDAGATLWQVLPLGPLGYGNSPYSSLSSHAANPLLLSVEDLVASGWLEPGDLADRPVSERVDYEAASQYLEPLLRRAWWRLDEQPREARERFEAFRGAAATAAWLDDWALYVALKHEAGGRSWLDWPAALRRRDPQAVREARQRLAQEISFHAFVQFLLAEQLDALREEAARCGVRLLGDLPYYPALDSADVWSRPDLFDLDETGRPRHVAGVPPDAFAASGQLWGNPTYLWERHAAEGYRWWIDRVGASLRFVDCLRLDHFRGFADYWAVPAGERTAAGGNWVGGPGEALFDALRQALGGLPFVAEDLGLITAKVRSLRRSVGIPGMRVLQFAFEMPDSEHRPDRVPEDSVVYTGTHDNDTTCGWFIRLRGAERRRALAQLRPDDLESIHLAMLQTALESDARWAVAPAQDLLGLDSEARLNTPGSSGGQWTWRLAKIPEADLAETLRRHVEDCERGPEA